MHTEYTKRKNFVVEKQNLKSRAFNPCKQAQFKKKEHLHDGCVTKRVLATPSSSSLRYSSSSSSSVTFDAWRPLIRQIKC